MHAARTGYREEQNRRLRELEEENRRLKAENEELRKKLEKLV
jgi:regulator of replication initiation timing